MQSKREFGIHSGDATHAEQVARAATQALDRAQRRAAPVFLRFAQRKGDRWPLALNPNALDDASSFFWSGGSGEPVFAALGVVGKHSLEKGSLATLARRVSERAWETMACGAPECGTLPLWVGGAGFDTEGIADRPWEDWPGAAWWTPRLLAYTRGTVSGLVATVRVKPDDNQGHVIDRLRESLALGDHWWRNPVSPPIQTRAEPNLPPTPTAQVAWTDQVNRAVAAIQRGALHKVVLARSEVFEAPAGTVFDPHNTLLRLHAAYPDAFCFSCNTESAGTFVGATPELLVRVRDGVVESGALAGTVARGCDATENEALAKALRQDPKQQDEHETVVSAVVAALNPLCRRLVRDPEPHVLSLPNVQHLRTRIHGQLRPGFGVLEAATALHPTPAVNGAPAEAAHDLRRTLEPMARGWYAGPIGWMDAQGHGTFAVALRAALVEARQAWAYAGAGIVAASDPVAEWDETVLKLRPIADALSLARGRT